MPYTKTELEAYEVKYKKAAVALAASTSADKVSIVNVVHANPANQDESPSAVNMVTTISPDNVQDVAKPKELLKTDNIKELKKSINNKLEFHGLQGAKDVTQSCRVCATSGNAHVPEDDKLETPAPLSARLRSS
jgi:hypothetical protein